MYENSDKHNEEEATVCRGFYRSNMGVLVCIPFREIEWVLGYGADI